MKNIIFLFGLPRSGSTLLQRMLAAHSSVQSIAEPWLLLPLVTCFDSKINMSIYGHNSLEIALNDLELEHEGLHEDYEAHIRLFVTKVYDSMRGDKKYFLDKTPRYYLIAKELKKIFPQSKFIYLFRNPISVFDSSIETFCANRLYNLASVHYDMAMGLDLLTSSIADEFDPEFIQLNYEGLCNNPKFELNRICNYLEIDAEEPIEETFKDVKFQGKYGDPKRNLHPGVTSVAPESKPLTFVRRRYYIKLLNKISDRALNISGYSRNTLIDEVNSRPPAPFLSQLFELIGYMVFLMALGLGVPLYFKYKNKKRFGSDAFFH